MRKYSYGKNKFYLTRKKIAGLLSIAFGLIVLLYFFFPLISYHLYLSSAFASSNIQAPLPQRFVLNDTSSFGGLFSTGLSHVTSNYKDARNWFPQIKKDKQKESETVAEYQLSIPSQKIDHAKVSSTDFDLSKHLVQYFSTSKNPVDKGTSVIFGHSTLPQLFNPKNYTAIFANLHLLKSGEEIILTVNGQDYKYKVFSISIMGPDDPNIFSQSYDNSYITIITCTPPGTTWKRLVVRASYAGMGS